MSNTRTLLVLMLALMGFMIWNQWQQDYSRPTAPPPEIVGDDGIAPAPAIESDVPQAPATDLPELDRPAQPAATQFTAPSEQVNVQTDLLKLAITTVGGTIVEARLREYPVAVDQPEQPFTLLEQNGGSWFVAQSGLVSDTGAAPSHAQTYSAARLDYQMDSASDELRVPLVWEQDGVRVTKTFIFKRGSYTIDVEHRVENNAAAAIRMGHYAQLQRTPKVDSGASGLTNPEAYSYFGAAVYDPEEKFIKLAFDDFRSEPFERTIDNGWLAMVQHYFLAAWIPPAGEARNYSTQEVTRNGPLRYRVRYLSSAVEVPAAGQHVFSDRLYVGPKIQDHLDDVAPGLRYTVDYGVMTFIAKPLFWALEMIHSLVRNWGLAIIGLTLLIKLLFYKLTEAQFRSMARMRKLQPRIEALKERYGDDRQKMSQAMMDMYRKEKVNPLGGCLPILVQIPVFISLYWVLLESVELRQAPFILWIQDLSARDPYFVLPVLNGLAMIATQRMTPTPGMDPVQRRVMQSMPIVFSVLFAFFPAGLVLYWTTNAISSLAQQWYITRRIEREG
ncbi:MAG: membrane protein insertase YidC [Wenzhouxiangellaceae bacterium]